MEKSKTGRVWKLFEVRVLLIILAHTLVLAACFYYFIYRQFMSVPISDLKNSAQVVYDYVATVVDESSFTQLQAREDEDSWQYKYLHEQLHQVKQIANIRYLYTATQNEQGQYVYVVDGLDFAAEDFRHIGDLIEEENLADLDKCYQNQIVFGDGLIHAEWGVVYLAYFPVTNAFGEVVGAIGMEFDAENLDNVYGLMQFITVIISVVLLFVACSVTILLLRKAVDATGAELSRRDDMLLAVNHISHLLLSSGQEEFGETVEKAVQVLGEGTGADRISLWVNEQQRGEVYISARSVQWAKNGLAEAPTGLQTYTGFYPEWQQTLRQGQSVCGPVAGIPQLVRGGVVSEKARRVLLVPILLNGDFWGCVATEYDNDAGTLQQVEERILRSGGLLLASAFMRNEMLENLVKAKEEAQASTRAKTEFLSRMSHEIRTPMNAIIGMTTIAQKAKDASRIEYCLGKIQTASDQLLSLINDILDMSKIEADKFELSESEFDFDIMLQNVCNVVEVKAAEKKQEFTIDFPEVFERNIVSDELRISQVLINLLSNAVKFTPERGRIKLRIRFESVDKTFGRIHFEILDNGIGISAEQQQRLFNSFEQADGSITRRYGGTGLGLAISKRIVQMLGGEIQLASELGKGSCFSFSIGVSVGNRKGTLDLIRKLPLGDIRILAIDDSEEVRLYFKNILETYQLYCETASDGQAGIQMVAEAGEQGKPYNLIFIDWMMPGMDGIETARHIKALAPPDTIVIMISVVDWSEIEKEAKEIGVDKFLAKPILPTVLFQSIVEWLNDAEKQKQLPTEGLSSRFAGKTMLLAEDIEINREIIISMLEDTDIAIIPAEDGLEAVEQFQQDDRFDIIVMDVQMPNLDGLEATRRIRALGTRRARTVPIVAMTANAFVKDMEDCISAGMDDYIAKPVDFEQLMEMLDKYLN